MTDMFYYLTLHTGKQTTPAQVSRGNESCRISPS